MLSDYTSLLKACWRIYRQTPCRLLWKICRNFAWNNFWWMRRFERNMKDGRPFFPAFNMISVTETCNLQCSGCWVTAHGRKSLSPAQIDGIIAGSKREGSTFFGILGGEPLMYRGNNDKDNTGVAPSATKSPLTNEDGNKRAVVKDNPLFGLMEKHRDCYFQLFTNATLLTDEVAQELRRLGNVTPLISVEGLKEESDRRRGRNDVYERTLQGIRACRKAGLIFGIAASICQSNLDELMSEEHIKRAVEEGAAYLWYYIYRPVGAVPNPANALTREQVRRFREFLVEQRRKAPIIIVDTYWDEEGRAMCPAATGMSHHIGPTGAVEFCPPLQMAREFLNENGTNITDIYHSSNFLAQLREMTAEASRGCILLEDPARLAAFLKQHQAMETTSRATFMKELEAMTPKAGHDMRDEAIPEKNPLYRWLKKRYFFGFGAYG